MASPCARNVSQRAGILEREAEAIIQRMRNIAQERVRRFNTPMGQALRDVAGELSVKYATAASVSQRNSLLAQSALNNVKDFARRFKTLGEGVLTLLEGSSKTTPGARLSIDYQGKAINGKYFGQLVNALDEAGVFHEFRTGSLTREVYREMARLHDTTVEPGTRNERAYKIAKIVDDVANQMIARENRAGSFLTRIPGYIAQQTHDTAAIRALGKDQASSYRAWADFVRPMIDVEKTTHGADLEHVLRRIHEDLYIGIPGRRHQDAIVTTHGIDPDLARHVADEHTLWFNSPDAAYEYNQKLGNRDFKSAVINDIHKRARTIALQENLGPTPQATLTQAIKELQEESRGTENSVEQFNSLRQWGIRAAMDELTGRNEVPANFTLSRSVGVAKAMLQLSRMGGVMLSSFADKAFLQSEMAYQGISNLTTLGKQLTGMFPRAAEQKSFLRLMGVAMDGLMGNTLSRYSSSSGISGWAHSAQRKFFDLNFLNSWTDANKATAAELMSAHLGEHAGMKFSELPGELQKILPMYEITTSRWDALRETASTHGDRVGKFITPDKVADIPDYIIKSIVEEQGLTGSRSNILRERDRLETSLRTYFQDRLDIAIPTPGVSTRRWATMNTQAGTPLGEAVRLLTLFKSFPITIMDKVVGRSVYGQGAQSIGQFVMSDHKGKFNLAMLVAMATAAGYLSGAARDALKGRSPKPLALDDGSFNWEALNDAALRGGGLGILGDTLLQNFDHDRRTFLQYAAGPILGQLDDLAALKTQFQQGQNISAPAGKMLLDNAPFINLFYIRPVLDYFIMWNLEEMMSPGTLRRRESAVEQRGHQQYFMRPSELVNQ